MRLVSTWLGGSTALRRFRYKLVEEGGAYSLYWKLASLPDSAYKLVERYEHAAAQRVAGHERLDDLDRAEWRRRAG